MISANFQEEVWNKLNSIERRLIGVSSGIPPVDAEYVVMSLNATLTGERRLQAAEGISLTDGGAGNDADLALDVNGLVEDAAGASGDFFVYYDVVAGDHKKIDWDDMPGGGGGFWTQVGVDIYYDDGGSVVVGTPAPSSMMTEGITIFQGGSDDEILVFQSSDVAHGMTAWADTDTYFQAKKADAARGGVWMGAFISTGSPEAFVMGGSSPTINSTKTTAGAQAVISLWTAKMSGTGVTSMDQTANLFRIWTWQGAWYSKFWVDANGDTYQSGDIFSGNRGNNQTPQQTIRRRDSNNIWIGVSGGAAWSTGDRNYSLGDYALSSLNSGADNVALGYRALVALTSGHNNIAIGHDSMEANQTALYCIAMGPESLESHTSGNGVIAIGKNAAWNDGSVPQYNIYIGYESGQTTATLGANCIGIGYHTLQNNTGAENVTIGYNSMSGAGAGGSNTVVGSAAGQVITSGNQNTILGADAGDNFSSGSDNVAVGFQAGDGTSTGSQNVFIGSQADGNAVAARTNSIGIGYNVSVDADNKCILGNSSQTLLQTYGDISTTKGANCRVKIYDTVDGTTFPGIEVGHADVTWSIYITGGSDGLAFYDGAANVFELYPGGAVLMIGLASGATQAAAGAAANELWFTVSHATLPDNVVMIGA